MTMRKALYPNDDIDCMGLEKNKEEDLPAFRIA